MDNGKTYDILIIGCGPAGFSAAVNAKIREKKLLLVGGGAACADKIQKAPRVDNYLGFPHTTGQELNNKFLAHIKEMGITPQRLRVDAVYPSGDTFQVMIKGDFLTTRAVILATGLTVLHYLPGEEDLVGKGVGYCATCDGPLYRGKKVLLIGETEEAQEEANFLAELCDSVTYFARKGGTEKLQSRVKIGAGKPRAVQGAQKFQALETDQGTHEADGLFIIRDTPPLKDLAPGLELSGSFIKVDRSMATNIPGVFAAGDCTGQPFQIAKAVGEGLVAALSAAKYLDAH